MDTMWTQQDIQQAIASVSAKAAADQAFRALAVNNPREAIRQATGKDVPEIYTLKLVEADPNADLTLVVPPLQTDELSDHELDQVAGGRSCRDQCKDLTHCDVY